MTVAKFVQPNYLTQTAAAYKAAIDAAFAVLATHGADYACHAKDTPDMQVLVDAGSLFLADSTLVSNAQQTSATIVAPVTNPRIDRIVINDQTGVVSVIAGTEAASPTAPAITAGTRPIAQILLQTSSTVISNSMITDERVVETYNFAAFVRTLLDDADAAAFVETLRNSLAAETVTADDDEIILRDTSVPSGKRMTFANFIARILTVARTFTAAHVHQGAETHSGIEVFSGTPSIDLTGGQIKFPATQSASANANTLDDYEEGTWTPTILFGGAGTGNVYSTQNGGYTKVGRLVTFACFVGFSSSGKGSATGAASIGGLPFSALYQNCAVSVAYISTITFTGQLTSYKTASGTECPLEQTTEAGARTSLTDANFANSSAIMLCGHYIST